jgi:hypothetical protein
MSKETEKTGLELLKVESLPAFIDAKAKQEKLVEENPFVEIGNHASYEQAKKNCHNLLKGRTSIEKEIKMITAKVNDFKADVKEKGEELIVITKVPEQKQKNSIKAYEEAKAEEKRKKQQEEKDRIDAIKARIEDFKNTTIKAINDATLETIEGLAADMAITELDVSEFEELLQETKDDLFLLVVEKRKALATAKELKIEAEKQRLKDKEQKRRDQEIEANRQKLIKEQQEAKAKIELGRSRMKIITGYGIFDYDIDALSEMSDEDWSSILSAENGKAQLVAAEKKAALYSKRSNLLDRYGFSHNKESELFTKSTYSVSRNDLETLSEDDFTAAIDSIYTSIEADKKAEKLRVKKEEEDKKLQFKAVKYNDVVIAEKNAIGEAVLPVINIDLSSLFPEVSTPEAKKAIKEISAAHSHFIQEITNSIK